MIDKPTLKEIKDQFIIDILSISPELTAGSNWSDYSRLRNFVFANVSMADKVYDNILKVYNDLFYDTASEDALELYLQDKNLERGEATKSTSTIRIGKRTEPVETTIIPANFKVSTAGDNPIGFGTLSQVQIDPSTPVDSLGYYTVEVDVISDVPGSNTNVTTGSINTLVSFLSGVNVVYSTAPATGGTDIESRENMISRLKNTLFSIDNTIDWYESNAENFSFVKSAYAVCGQEGNGHLMLYLAGYSSLTTEQLEEVEDYFNEPERNDVGAIVVTTDEIVTFSTNITLKVYRFSTTTTDTMIEDAIEDYFNNIIKIGKDFVINDLIWYLKSNLNYIYDIEITVPSSNIVVEIYEIITKGTVNLTIEEVDEE